MFIPRVLSVNVVADLHHGAAWTGSDQRSGIDKRPVDGPRLLAGDAVEGDAVINTVHHGGPWQAVYAYAREDAEFAAYLCSDAANCFVGQVFPVCGGWVP